MNCTPGWTAESWIDYVKCHRNSAGNKSERKGGVTRWYRGDVKPAYKGWYERIFIEGIYRQHWNGRFWSMQKDGFPHWREVGDYPAWRGLTEPAFKRGAA